MDLESILYRIPGILVALTVHEFAHAWTAWRCGDSTAKEMGRMNLNPLSHLTVLGTAMIFFGPFGWGKPVPVNYLNLANPKRDMAIVSLAGPLSNLLLAIPIGLLLRFYGFEIASFSPELFEIIKTMFIINLVLTLFNLIPIQPLDGEKIFLGLLPYKQAIAFQEKTQHAPAILMGVLLVGWVFNFSPLNFIFLPWINLWWAILIG